MGEPTRPDNYLEARKKLQSGTKSEAMARLWQMAREALAARAALGVRELHYETDMVVGVDQVEVHAHPRHVELKLTGITFPQAAGDQNLDEPDPITYVLDEAWLIAVAP